MERLEAIREWCVEKAVVLETTKDALSKVEAERVIESAKKLEKYITG